MAKPVGRREPVVDGSMRFGEGEQHVAFGDRVAERAVGFDGSLERRDRFGGSAGRGQHLAENPLGFGSMLLGSQPGRVSLCSGENPVIVHEATVLAWANDPVTANGAVEIVVPSTLVANGLSDTDVDGVPDLVERSAGTNPRSVDTDGDLLRDWYEMVSLFTGGSQQSGINLNESDSDFDTVPDAEELVDQSITVNGESLAVELLDIDASVGDGLEAIGVFGGRWIADEVEAWVVESTTRPAMFFDVADAHGMPTNAKTPPGGRRLDIA